MKASFIVTTLLAAGLSVLRATAAPVPLAADVSFRGTSTLHAFEGNVRTEPFDLTWSTHPETGAPCWSADVRVRVTGMSTHHAKRDRNMYHMLNAKDHPVIAGAIRNAPVPTNDTAQVELAIRIHDREQTIPATVTGWEQSGTETHFQLDFTLSLGASQLSAPSVLGLIRVGDTVDVHCDVGPAPPETALTQPAAGADTPTGRRS